MSRYHHSSLGWALLEGAVKLIWRWNTGAELDGHPRTDATWTARGEQALTKSGRASKWSHLPRLWRAGIRHAAVLAAFMTLYGLAVAPVLTRIAWGVALCGVAAWGVRRVRAAREFREHRQTYVMPLGQTLGPMIGHTDINRVEKIERWLTFPVDFFTNEERPELRVALSRTMHYDDKLKTAVLKLIADKLGRGLDDLDWQWHGMGAAPYISVRLAPKPPAHAGADVLLPLIAKAKDSAPVMGIGARGRVITSDFDAESPHVAVSAGTGAGKSVWGRLMIAQFLKMGAQVIILDKKRVSQNWCKNLPGVTYCREAAEMHEVLLKLAAELQRRYEIIDAAEDPDTADVGPRLVLFFEEQNFGMRALKKYWDEIREKSDPKASPAVDALEELLFAGRQARLHVVSIAQMFTVKAAGGNTEARENYATRIMARATAQAWKMLLPECAPFPKMNKKRGRWYIGVDGSAVEFQVGFLSEEEAVTLAGSGHVTVPAQWDSGIEQSREAVTAGSVTEQAGPVLYTLREAVDSGFVGEMSYDSLRQRKSRDKENFPKGVKEGNRERWTEEQIRTWYAASVLLQGIDSGTDAE